MFFIERTGRGFIASAFFLLCRTTKHLIEFCGIKDSTKYSSLFNFLENFTMFRRKFAGVLLVYVLLLPAFSFGQSTSKLFEVPKETFDKIKEEGTTRSQVMQTLGYMSDVIGPRLTASPG